MTAKRLAGVAALVGSLLLVAAERPSKPERPSKEDLLWQYRNLGKAFYENPDTHVQSAQQLEKALALDPASARDRLNFGLALLHSGQTEQGIVELLKVQKQDPSLPYTWFNLGIAYKHASDYEHAIAQFQGMIKLVPDEPAGHYNLASVLRSKGDNPAALAEFQTASRLNPDLAGPHFQLFSLLQRMGQKDLAARERKAFEEAKKRDEGAAVPENMEWCFYAELYDPPEPRDSALTPQTQYDERTLNPSGVRASGLLLIDRDGSGHADLVVWSHDRVALYSHASAEIKDAGLGTVHDALDVAAGDFDNDGLTDLAVLNKTGVALFHNNHGVFAKAADLPASGASRLLWLDYDHDYDLDLLLFGSSSTVLRNEGDGKFEAKTGAFPFVKGQALSAALFASRADTAARDIVVSYADRPGVLYSDRLNGSFEAADIPQLPPGTREIDAQDINHDGLLDLALYGTDVSSLINTARDEDSPASFTRAGRDGVARSAVRADFNGDTREDYARLLPDGSVHIYTNASAGEHWAAVAPQGVKNIKQALGATVEIKSGPYYEKRIATGVPLSFAVDGRGDLDTVRITWPNGLIQNEPHQKTGATLKIAEAQRLSGSCPMIFTWNGSSFEFITDVLGVAPLGASSGDGHYFPVAHNEAVQIPGSALQPVHGKFQVHITEELHEVSYLDQVKLVAVDHPAALAIYTNDKFKSPPYPEFRLFGASRQIHPFKATDAKGVDVSSRVSRLDRRYPDNFRRTAAGVAELHTLDLDFGAAAANRAVLFLNGWVDWADGSTFLAASQGGKGLIFPYLQVKDSAGRWQTVVPDMGIPSGKPKTIAVDLTGKFLSRSREVRIVTNLCVYWDEIFLSDSSAPPSVRLTDLDPQTAALHFRGFSQPVIDQSRLQPERFLYSQVQPISNWNPTRGLYTRYGDVQSLVGQIDDRLIVMGSGDELKLEFPSTSLPRLPTGWTRDYLLLVDGWAKDSDANTAFSQSVGPLPFHAMSAYPYGPNESFPTDAAHARYLREYLTRPALRLVRPLAPSSHQGK